MKKIRRTKDRSAGAGRSIQNKKLVLTVYLTLRVLVVMVMVAQLLNRNYENAYICVLTLLLFTIPSIAERKLRVDLPDTLEIIILIFIFSAEILGEIKEYYLAFPFWDTLLHTVNGFLFAAIGFSLVNILNEDKRVSLTLAPLYMALTAFCFSMTIGVLWEFFEWGDGFLLRSRYAERYHRHGVQFGDAGSRRAQYSLPCPQCSGYDFGVCRRQLSAAGVGGLFGSGIV